MNRPALPTTSNSHFAPGPWLLAALIVGAALTRLLPHPPNFSPVEAIALFGGAYFASRAWALLVPLIAMFIADVGLAAINGGNYAAYVSHAGFWTTYTCIALSTLLGFGLRGKVSGGRVLGYALTGSVLFFVLSNLSVWAFDSMYPHTANGLAAAYIAGLPFFQWTVLGTLFYAAILFGGFALLRDRVPALRAQTV